MRFVVLLATWLLGCAANEPERIAPEMVLGAAASPPAAAAVLNRLQRFVTDAEAIRAHTPRGAPMPPSHIERWSTLLDEAEALTRLGTRALELVRGRLWLQTSWEADAAHFGDVPWPLAQKSQRLLRLITHRLAAANREATAVDPNLFWWPLSPVVVTSPWGHRTHPIHGDYRFHAGVDLEAELEQPVFAAGPGIVAFAGWNAGHGKYIALQHGARLSTTYSHLDGFSVQNGDTVRRGDLIGFAGQTGAATGVHLHFELRRDGEPLDPEDILGAGAFGRRVSAR